MDYSDLIKRAWQITWRYKFLWVFGIVMALCGQGSNSRGNVNFRTSAPFEPGRGMPDFPDFFPEPFGQTPLWLFITIILVIVVVFAILGLIVGAIGRGALIQATVRAEAGESFGLGQSWQDGLAKAVPLGLLQLVLSLPLLLLLALFLVYFFIELWPSISAVTLPRGTPQLPPGFQRTIFSFIAAVVSFVCCFALLQLFTGIFTVFGSRAIVLEDQGVWSAFGRGWQRFRHNLGPTVILAIILFLLTMVVGFALAIPAATVMFPVMMMATPRIFSENGPSIGTWLLLGGVTLLVVLIFTFINGVFRVFIETLWTLAYRTFMMR